MRETVFLLIPLRYNPVNNGQHRIVTNIHKGGAFCYVQEKKEKSSR